MPKTLGLIVIRSLGLDKNPQFAGPGANTESSGTAAPDPAKENALLARWHEGLQVTKIQRTRMIEIRFLSPNPKIAAQVVNTLATSYVEHNYKTRFESTMQASEWLQNQLNDLQIKVETS